MFGFYNLGPKLENLIFAASILVLVSISYSFYSRNADLSDANQRVSHTTLVQLSLERTISATEAMENTQRGYLLTGDSAFIRAYPIYKAKVRFYYNYLDSLVEDTAEDVQLQLLNHMLIRESERTANIFQNYHFTPKLGFIHETYLNESKLLLDSIRKEGGVINALTDRQLVHREAVKARYTFLTPVTALLLIIFSLLVIVWYYARLKKQLQVTTNYTDRLSKNAIQTNEINQTFRQAEEMASMGNFKWDIPSQKMICSENLMRLFGGKTSEDIMPFDQFMNYVHSEDRAIVADMAAKAIAEPAGATANFRLLANTDQVKYVKGSMRLASGNAGEKRVLGIIQDVTVQVLAQRVFERRKAMLRKAQQIAHMGSWEWDFKTDKLEWSDELYRLFGIDPASEIDPVATQELIHQEDRALVNDGILQSRQFAAPLDIQYRRWTNEKVQYLHTKGTIVRDEHGNVTGLFGITIDITDQTIKARQLEKATTRLTELNNMLQQKNEALQSSNEELDSFSYVAGHDLLEPLRKIQTFTTMIMDADGTVLSDNSRKYFSRMHAAAGRMQNLINDLLSYSRINTTEKKFDEIDLNKLLAKVKTDIHDAIDEVKAEIIADPLPVVQGIQFQVQQLFENLINNSLKYCRQGVPPVIKISSSLVHKVQGENGFDAPTGNYCCIGFKDNGIGFEPQYARKIFEIFQRLHGKQEYSGTGLGLTICKRIILHHRGYIQAEGHPDQGSVFTVFLPA